MIKEHDCVVLTSDFPDEKLEAGDVGTVVHIHKDGAAYEVEFTTLDGHTVAVATVADDQLRPVSPLDISHVRQLPLEIQREALDFVLCLLWRRMNLAARGTRGRERKKRGPHPSPGEKTSTTAGRRISTGAGGREICGWLWGRRTDQSRWAAPSIIRCGGGVWACL
jgi:hypothetical protein